MLLKFIVTNLPVHMHWRSLIYAIPHILILELVSFPLQWKTSRGRSFSVLWFEGKELLPYWHSSDSTFLFPPATGLSWFPFGLPPRRDSYFQYTVWSQGLWFWNILWHHRCWKRTGRKFRKVSQLFYLQRKSMPHQFYSVIFILLQSNNFNNPKWFDSLVTNCTKKYCN